MEYDYTAADRMRRYRERKHDKNLVEVRGWVPLDQGEMARNALRAIANGQKPEVSPKEEKGVGQAVSQTYTPTKGEAVPVMIPLNMRDLYLEDLGLRFTLNGFRYVGIVYGPEELEQLRKAVKEKGYELVLF